MNDSKQTSFGGRFLILAAAFLAVFFGSFLLGRYTVPPGTQLKILGAEVLRLASFGRVILPRTWSGTEAAVVLNIRLPRIFCAALVGAALSTAGASYQGMFRNPMVSPDLMGASTGAGFGAALAILLSFSYFGVMLTAFCFGLAAVLLAYLVSRFSRLNATLALVLAGVMMETALFTDSAGRQVTVPSEITRVAPSGAVATMYLASVCPEYMVCIASTPSSAQYKYLDERLLRLPTTGQLYGSKSTINLEALMDAQPQIIIDLGDAKDGIGRDMDALQKQTGIPVVFIEADLPHMAQAFRRLGELLYGKAARCEELAAYVDETVSLAAETAGRIPEEERVSVMYATGVSGLNANAEGSTQAQVIGLVGAKNAITVEDVSDRGGGNPINMEQLYNFDPDAILFTTGSMYGDAAGDESWRELRAVASGAYYEIPGLPYNWMSSPPSLNMLLGIRWLGNLLYPRYYDYDMAAEARRAYALLWNYDLSEAEAAELLRNSTLKGAAS